MARQSSGPVEERARCTADGVCYFRTVNLAWGEKAWRTRTSPS
jgi:hypothetical protein